MRKTIFTFVLLLAGIAKGIASAPTDTIRVYTIDGETCNNFTGQQLVGKTVTDYEVKHCPFAEAADGKKHVVEMHKIKTLANCTTKTETKVVKLGKPLIIIDGEEKDVKLSDLPSDDIRSVDIFKDPKVCAAYGEKAAGGVIRIVTKACKNDPMVYLVGGEVMSSAKMKTIPSEQIKEVNIYKAGTKEATKYTRDGALMVVTLK